MNEDMTDPAFNAEEHMTEEDFWELEQRECVLIFSRSII